MRPVNAVVADDPGNATVKTDGGNEALVVRELTKRGGNESSGVRGLVGRVQPRVPTSEVKPIGVNHGKQLVRIRKLEQTQFMGSCDLKGEHLFRLQGARRSAYRPSDRRRGRGFCMVGGKAAAKAGAVGHGAIRRA